MSTQAPKRRSRVVPEMGTAADESAALRTLIEEVRRVLAAARLPPATSDQRGYTLDHGNRPPITLTVGDASGIGAPDYTATERHEQVLRAAGFRVERGASSPTGAWKYLRVARPTP